MSAQVLMPASAQMTTTAASSVPLPSQSELGRLELRGLPADQRLQRDAAAEHADAAPSFGATL